MKIDYILTTPGIEVMSSEILRMNREGRYPSDYYPMVSWLPVKSGNNVATMGSKHFSCIYAVTS